MAEMLALLGSRLVLGRYIRPLSRDLVISASGAGTAHVCTRLMLGLSRGAAAGLLWARAFNLLAWLGLASVLCWSPREAQRCCHCPFGLGAERTVRLVWSPG